ncbi:MAG: ABC transporter permease subunit [Verrucomicrobiota bacterium]|nr:ABC transporter permease subunit [Verrucomicrobiota bacterium]
MKTATINNSGGAPLQAMLWREVRGSISSRYFQVFCAIALVGGTAATVFAEDASAAGLFILQLSLYCVSLFAVLLGVNSARAESREWPLLFSQPIPRSAFLLGKFIALALIFASALLLLFLPALFTAGRSLHLAQLYVFTTGLTCVFLALGLAAGFLARERVQGLILALAAWLFLLVGFDLVALFGAQWPLLQKVPDFWAALLMTNPLDAFRIQALFAMEQIPAEAANSTPLAAWWLAHPGLWFALISIVWMSGLLGLTAQRLARWEE